jgi:DNA-binding XRE family transcriptional regulator
MTRDEFIQKLNEKLKLIRTEHNYSQERMAEILGMSKKTLVQIEKGRATLGWSGAVTLCALFGQSEIIAITFGGQPTDIIMALAFNGAEHEYPKTMGGKIWWSEVETTADYKIQRNIISQHYRILDNFDHRICASFNYDYIKNRLQELQNGYIK